MSNNTLNNTNNSNNSRLNSPDKSINNSRIERPTTSKLNNSKSNINNTSNNNKISNTNTNNSNKGFSFKEEKVAQGTNSAVPLTTDHNKKKTVKDTKSKLDLNVQKERFDEILKEEKEKQNKKRLEEFEKTLNNKLCDMLVEERKKEQEREILLQECKDPDEKKRLTKILAMEKADANERIVSFNK